MKARALVPSLLLGLLLVTGCTARQISNGPAAPEQPVAAASEAPAKTTRAASAPADSAPLADARARESDLSDTDLATLRKNLGKDAFDQTGTAGWTELPGLTAAHPSLPVGSKVEVTNLDNSKRALVMITDRGQEGGRIIDLSPAAAEQLGMPQNGTARVGLRVLDRPRGKAAQKAAKKAAVAAARPAPKPRQVQTADDDAVSPEDMITADEAAAPASSKKKTAKTSTKSTAKASSKAAAKTQAAAKTPAKASALAKSEAAPAKAAGGKYYVQVGSFASPENAEKLVKRLKGQGYGGSRQMRVETGGKVLYRVQAGSFPNKTAAETALKTLKGEFPSGYVTGD